MNIFEHRDCLEALPGLPDKSVDMVMCDLPYGTTACRWDVIIPFEPLWKEYKRIIKDNGAIVLTASQPFTSMLVMSNLKMFKYEWVWEKNNTTGHLNVKARPLKQHENILVFSDGSATSTRISMKYNPQGVIKINESKKNTSIPYCGNRKSRATGTTFLMSGKNYPKSVLRFCLENTKLHPTQKPVALFEYLIKTYTNEGETVLDNCAGSGTTAIACLNLNRNYICYEKDKGYFDIATKRIGDHQAKLKLF